MTSRIFFIALFVATTSTVAIAQTAKKDAAKSDDACLVDMAANRPAQKAQDSKVKTIDLVQTPGEFTTKELKLKAGKYEFNVMNKGVDHPIGFVIASVKKASVKKGDKDQEPLVKFGPIGNGETKTTPVVELKKGKYDYFCPLNPTPRYALVVE